LFAESQLPVTVKQDLNAAAGAARYWDASGELTPDCGSLWHFY